jgi:hypothetical protein
MSYENEYIADVRAELPGDGAIDLGPVPGFLDNAGNLITEGDWVMVGVGGRSSYGPRLARVLSIEPEEYQAHAGYEDIPEDKWTEWDRRQASYGRKPQRQVWQPAIRPKIEVAQYPDMDPGTRPIRRQLQIRQALKYTGNIPFDMS